MSCRFFQATGFLAPWLLLLMVVAAGCGSGENRVSGNITFDGKPVPSGKIYFTPDTSKGNSGPTGYADIEDGFYDTAAATGKGVAQGPMVVAIEGLAPLTAPASGEGAEDITATVLFPRYETRLELSGGAVTHDIEVPAEAANGPPQPVAAAFVSP